MQADAADEITEDVLRQVPSSVSYLFIFMFKFMFMYLLCDVISFVFFKCRTCGNSYFTLSQMGIALSFELPGDIFDAPLNFNLRESERLKVIILPITNTTAIMINTTTTSSTTFQ